MQNIDAILSSAAIGKPLHNKQHEDTVTQLGPPLSRPLPTGERSGGRSKGCLYGTRSTATYGGPRHIIRRGSDTDVVKSIHLQHHHWHNSPLVYQISIPDQVPWRQPTNDTWALSGYQIAYSSLHWGRDTDNDCTAGSVRRASSSK